MLFSLCNIGVLHEEQHYWCSSISALCCGQLQVRPYQEDEVVIIVGRDHPLAGCAEMDRKELADLKFVSLHRSSTLQGIKASLEQHGIEWKTLQTVMVRLISCSSA